MSKFLTDTLDGIEITRAKDVAKHGDHDQSSHGSWAQGVQVAPEIVRSTLERVKENGGLSVSLKDGSEPTKGFMVAKGKKFAAIVKADDFFDEDKGAEILSSYMKRHKAEFNNTNNYLGLWHNTDDGQVYLDVSENIKDEGEAISRGRDRDQISIWDVSNFKEIETGGTGGIEKTRGGRTARYVKHDGRTNRRLRQRDLGEVSKTLKVIYFDYGLKPVFKHEGHEDQSSHGNWALGYTSEQKERIENMKSLGPSLEDLDNVMKIKEETEFSDEQLKLTVENDSDFYREATQDIDDKVAERLQRLQEEFPNHEYSEQEKATIYEDVQNEMVQEYVETYRDMLTEYETMASGESSETELDPEELVPFFEEVYNVSHTGTNADGQEITINSSISQVFRDGDSIYVRGDITDDQGSMVGELSRRFFKEDGVWNVEHEVLAIPDPTYQGTGFGKAIIEQSEAWYTARGMGYIQVGTAWDGARHWARAGYDWKPDRVSDSLQTIANNVEYVEGFERGTPARQEFDALMSRATNNYQPDFEDESGNKYPAWDSVKDMKADDFPLPAHFANIGYTKGATEWAGKSLLYDLRLKYTKALTAEGQRLLEGPIDHDGDGLIYDGTAREKPAPSGGNK